MTTNLVTNLIILGCGLLNAVILARFLGPEERGEVAAVLLWPIILPYLGATGIIDALVYFAARSSTASKSAFGSSLILATVISAILIPIGYVALPWLLSSQSNEVVSISRLLLVGIPIILYCEMVSSMMRAKMALGSFNAQRLVVPVGYLLSTVLLYLSGHLSIWTIALFQLALWVVRLILSLALCWYSQTELRVSWDRGLTMEMLSFGGKSHVGAMAQRVSSQLDQMLIAGWLSPASLGYYVAAKSVSTLISTVPLAIKISVLPKLAREPNKTQQLSLISRITSVYWLYAILVAPVYAVGLIWIIPLVYGREFEAAIVPAIILLFGTVFFGAKDILGVASKAIGAPTISSVAEIVSLAVGGVLLLALVESQGLIGAAFASLSKSFIALLVVAVLLNRILSIPFATLLPSRTGIEVVKSYINALWPGRNSPSSKK